MFSVSISVVLLVFSVSQALGQTTTVVSPNPTTSAAVASASSVSGTQSSNSSNSTATPTTPVDPPTTATTTKADGQPATTPPPEKTCGYVRAVYYKAGKTVDEICATFVSALKELFRDPGKYKNVEVSEENCTEKGDFVFASAKLCLVFKEGPFIEEVFKTQVETGTFGADFSVKNDSAKFEPIGVSFKDWKAKEGECKEKCDKGAGPFFIVKECEPDKGFSCNGLKEPTNETDKCVKYCPGSSSTAVSVTVSSVILVIGIFLSSSFQ